MDLSLYVQKNKENYVNTVSLKILPLDSNEDTLRKENFLKGQELNSIYETLLKRPQNTIFQLISTWECNLRCHHCFSHKRLVKKQEEEVDVEGFKNFIKRFDDRYPEVAKTINFLGGEPTLKSEMNIRIIDAIKSLDLKGTMRFSMSTNLVKDLDDTDYKFMSMLDALQVSVDGTKKQHNDQRPAFMPSVYGVKDPYEQTLANIKRLLEKGIDFNVACAVNRETLSMEDKVEYFKNLLEAQVPFRKIQYGYYFNTDKAKANVGHEHIVPLVNPCCAFRFMRFIAVEKERNLVADFYNNDGQLGTFDDDLDLIEEKYKKFIINKLPVLSDPVCMKCPYLGQCWGGCIGSTYSREMPSNICNQDNIDKVHERREFIINNVNDWYQKEEENDEDWNSRHSTKC